METPQEPHIPKRSVETMRRGSHEGDHSYVICITYWTVAKEAV